jgi:hypothetical protein
VCRALIIDTTIAGDGTPGPYSLGVLFVDSSSIRAVYTDSTAGVLPPYVYIENINSLFFSQSIDRDKTIRVRYATVFQGVQKSYRLYKRNFIDLRDSLNKVAAGLYGNSTKFSEENLDISGFKSIGVSFGNQGQLNLEQALEVRIFGAIRENTILSANLSDQGTSLEGDTREIGEIDRMYISLENPRYNITAGDQYVSMIPEGIYRFNKAIKGISAAYTGRIIGFGAGAAISGGKFTVQTLSGRLGFQGPYYLTGQGESDYIQPVRGTVKVTVDAQELHEGEAADYMIDYDAGTLRFTPRFPISDGCIIQAHYEYKSFDYQRTFVASSAGVNNADSTISVKGAFWFETDNKNNPIDITLDKTMLDSLSQSGDNTPMVPNGREVNPNDVAAQDAINRLYKIVSTATIPHYLYAPYNSITPLETKGFYRVWFNPVAQGAGDYKQYDPALLKTEPSQITILWDTARLNATLMLSDPRGRAYVYVGKNKGNYSVLSPIPMPKRLMNGEVVATVRPTTWFGFTADVAAEEQDKNLFSSKDDKDNTASAIKSFVELGRNTFDSRSFWLTGAYNFSSSKFSQQILSPSILKNVWDDNRTTGGDKAKHLWDASAGSTILPRFSLQGSYGQYIRDAAVLTHRIGYCSRLNSFEPLDITYSGRTIHQTDSLSGGTLRGDSLSAVLQFKNLAYTLRFDDVWNRPVLSDNYGNIGAGLSVLLPSWNLLESVYYSQYRKGGATIFLPTETSSRDTGYSFIWSQGLNHSPIPGWTLLGNATYTRQSRINPQKQTQTKQSVLLVSVANDVSSVKTGFSTHQDYQLSSEQASAVVQIPVFVGKGQGDHVFNAALNEFVPAQFGDYIIQEREVFNQNGTESIRKSTLQATWFFKPYSKRIRGILADLSWQGTLHDEEHIRLDSALVAQNKMPGSAWIPGYTTLSGKNASLVNYADLFYRQDIDWRPSFWKDFHVNLYAKPYIRTLRSYDDHGLQWGTRLDKRWNMFEADLEGAMHSINRTLALSQNETLIKDYFLTLSQRFYIITALSLFANETAGITRKNEDRGPYYRLQPGITLRLAQKGWAELSYTWSRVNFDGIIEYPMAQGFNNGISHGIECTADISAGEHFSISGSYRGEFSSNSVINNKKWLHVVSMEVKAFL